MARLSPQVGNRTEAPTAFEATAREGVRSHGRHGLSRAVTHRLQPSTVDRAARFLQRVTILGIDEDAVLALFKDELDLEYVRLYHWRR